MPPEAQKTSIVNSSSRVTYIKSQLKIMLDKISADSVSRVLSTTEDTSKVETLSRLFEQARATLGEVDLQLSIMKEEGEGLRKQQALELLPKHAASGSKVATGYLPTHANPRKRKTARKSWDNLESLRRTRAQKERESQHHTFEEVDTSFQTRPRGDEYNGYNEDGVMNPLDFLDRVRTTTENLTFGDLTSW